MAAKQKKVTIYTTSWCTWCQRTKEFFKEHNIKYTEKNVEKDVNSAEEMIEKSGQRGVPVTDVDGEIIIGFDEPKLRKALNIK